MANVFRIRELRKKAGLTQREVALEVGYASESTTSMWEAGTRKPPSDILPKLAQVLHCSIDELYLSPDTDPAA